DLGNATPPAHPRHLFVCSPMQTPREARTRAQLGRAARARSSTRRLLSSSMPLIRTAELISVGTELLLGEIVDTNSAYLAADLATLGVDVLWSARVGDNEGRIAQLLDLALTRSDLVIMGGGLGP